MSQQPKVVFITGVSRGLGKALAEIFLSRGHIVVGTSRDGKAGVEPGAAELHVFPMDVTDREQVFRTRRRMQFITGSTW